MEGTRTDVRINPQEQKEDVFDIEEMKTPEPDKCGELLNNLKNPGEESRRQIAADAMKEKQRL